MTRKQSHRRFHPVLGIFLLVFLVSGCQLTTAQRKAVKEFGRATAVVGETASKEFGQMREETIEMNIHRITLKGIVKEGPEYTDLDEMFDPEHVSERVKFADSLKSYGELLLALVQDTQEKEIEDATDKFVENLGDLSFGDEKLDKEKLEACGEVVRVIGGLWVEARKAKAVKKIVPETKSIIGHICKKLENDLNPKHAGSIASGYLKTAEGLQRDARSQLLDPECQDLKEPHFKEAQEDAPDLEKTVVLVEKLAFLVRDNDCRLERAQAIQAYHLAKSKRDRYATLEKASDAVAKMNKAHAELADSITSDTVTTKDLEEFCKTVKSLVDALKDFD